MRVYIDGIEQNSLARTAVISTNNSPLWVGRTRLSGDAIAYLNGLMDDVGIYNSSLSAQRLSAIHGLGKYSGVDQADSFVDDVLTAFAGAGSATTGTHQWSYATAAQLGTSAADPIGTSGAGLASYFTLDSSGNGMRLSILGNPVTLIQVDFDDATLTPADVQAGWDGQAVVNATVSTIPVTLTADGTAAGITATLGGDSNTWESRDRGNAVTGTSFNDVIEELVATRDGGATVAFTGLTPGLEYTMRTWHNDPVASGFGTGGGTVTPSVVGGTELTSTVGSITNLWGARTDSDFGITSITFTATSTNPTVTWTGTNPSNFFPISGLQLTAIPEPSAFFLSAFALLGLLAFGRRRRSKRH